MEHQLHASLRSGRQIGCAPPRDGGSDIVSLIAAQSLCWQFIRVRMAISPKRCQAVWAIASAIAGSCVVLTKHLHRLPPPLLHNV